MMAAAFNIFDWLLERIGLVIFVLLLVAQMVRGLFKTKQENPPAQAKPDELEQQRRTQEIQEEIRRRRAERRGAPAPAEPPPLARREPPAQPTPRRTETTQMPEPFGGPLRRVLQEFEREARPQPVPAPIVERRNAELARQEQLAEQMRVLEESQMLAKRRATQMAATTYTESQSERGLRSVERAKVLDDLRDPAALRRAFVLREVLGTPVGLR
jgi:hypothetical protein